MGEIKNNISFLIFLLFFSFSSFAQEKLSLKDCIDRAIEKNISIKNSSLDLLNSTENKKTAIGNFVPSFNINGNHSWNTGLTQNITTGILENQTTENSSMNISVAVDVFNGLANIRRLHRANLDLLAKKYQLEDMKEDISLLVANSYLQILFNKEQLDVQKSQLKISQEELKNAKEKFNNGVIPEGNLFEIEANLALSEQNVIMAENGYQLSKLSLSQLLMFGDSDNFDIADVNYEIPKTDILNKDAKEILEEAMKNNFHQVLIDTAGRLQNKKNLMEEYKKIANVTKKIDPDAPHNVILVLDATSGQNIINQVEEFNKIIPITGIIMTKLDGTAKGGILLALAKKYKLPIIALGLGEKEDDLQLFDAEKFAEAFTQIN